jgi:hypothetical protein
LSSLLLSKNIKIKIYKTIILPVDLYGQAHIYLGGKWTMGQGNKFLGMATLQMQQNLSKIRLSVTDEVYQNTGYQC